MGVDEVITTRHISNNYLYFLKIGDKHRLFYKW